MVTRMMDVPDRRSLAVRRLRRATKVAVTWAPVNRALTTGVRAALPQGSTLREPAARYLPRAGLVEAPLPDGRVLRMRSRGDDDIATRLFWFDWAGHEPETARPFYELATSAQTTLDIGAHVGYFSLLAAHANPAGHVYAFEPLPRVFERLTDNVRLNDLPNVSCEPVALGSPGGQTEFFHVKSGIPSSSSLSRRFMQSIVPADQLTSTKVDVVQVDDFVNARGLSVDLVKMDTETTEDEVFRGMTETLARDRPHIFCEILDERVGQSIEQILRPLDYEFVLLTPTGEVRCEHLAPDGRGRNFLFRVPNRPVTSPPGARTTRG